MSITLQDELEFLLDSFRENIQPKLEAQGFEVSTHVAGRYGHLHVKRTFDKAVNVPGNDGNQVTEPVAVASSFGLHFGIQPDGTLTLSPFLRLLDQKFPEDHPIHRKLGSLFETTPGDQALRSLRNFVPTKNDFGYGRRVYEVYQKREGIKELQPEMLDEFLATDSPYLAPLLDAGAPATRVNLNMLAAATELEAGAEKEGFSMAADLSNLRYGVTFTRAEAAGFRSSLYLHRDQATGELKNPKLSIQGGAGRNTDIYLRCDAKDAFAQAARYLDSVSNEVEVHWNAAALEAGKASREDTTISVKQVDTSSANRDDGYRALEIRKSYGDKVLGLQLRFCLDRHGSLTWNGRVLPFLEYPNEPADSGRNTYGRQWAAISEGFSPERNAAEHLVKGFGDLTKEPLVANNHLFDISSTPKLSPHEAVKAFVAAVRFNDSLPPWANTLEALLPAVGAAAKEGFRPNLVVAGHPSYARKAYQSHVLHLDHHEEPAKRIDLNFQLPGDGVPLVSYNGTVTFQYALNEGNATLYRKFDAPETLESAAKGMLAFTESSKDAALAEAQKWFWSRKLGTGWLEVLDTDAKVAHFAFRPGDSKTASLVAVKLGDNLEPSALVDDPAAVMKHLGFDPNPEASTYRAAERAAFRAGVAPLLQEHVLDACKYELRKAVEHSKALKIAGMDLSADGKQATVTFVGQPAKTYDLKKLDGRVVLADPSLKGKQRSVQSRSMQGPRALEVLLSPLAQLKFEEWQTQLAAAKATEKKTKRVAPER
ncbi:hypothetical protein [Ramlibacter alkalitolerans]|uniref:Uncharacterized protein n=1 Tax=Ramlibacter alkalitolerans TaxID=2039631 RepID=A0ABS1JU54_9BURK|nr:hypothetical protein [Ramlibacter alkalitolerans]MBL0427825.1 hypothetical protein [Ramlibacter alkalitolerans]